MNQSEEGPCGIRDVIWVRRSRIYGKAVLIENFEVP